MSQQTALFVSLIARAQTEKEFDSSQNERAKGKRRIIVSPLRNNARHIFSPRDTRRSNSGELSTGAYIRILLARVQLHSSDHENICNRRAFTD